LGDYMKDFKLNQKIEIVAEDGKKTAGTIYDIQNDLVFLSVTAKDLSSRILRPGDHIDAILYCEDKIMAFTALVKDRIIGDLPLYVLTDFDNLTKAQRRLDVRVPCTLDLRYTHNEHLVNIDYTQVKNKKMLEEMDSYLSDGLILDISAGGVRIYIQEDLPLDKHLLLSFKAKEDMLLRGQIVYKDINMLPNKTTYFYGIKFLDIDERKREEIISFVFQLMRKNRIK